MGGRFALVALVLLVGGVGWGAWTLRNLPDVTQFHGLASMTQPQRVYAEEGELLGRQSGERRSLVSLGSIPKLTRDTVLAAEDSDFYQHVGVNWRGVLRAMWTNLTALGEGQGGSSITQQVARTVLLRNRSRTLSRKLRETVLAWRLEQQLSKDQILEVYLNSVYLGHGCYGFDEGARFYFGRGIAELELQQAAMLAGLSASPENFSPYRALHRALTRRRYVLDQMLAKGFIDATRYAAEFPRPLQLARPQSPRHGMPELEPLLGRELEALAERSEGWKDAVERGGYTVVGIRPELQVAARHALRRGVDGYLLRHSLLPPFLAGENVEFGAAFEGTPRAYRTYVGRVVAADDAAGTLDVRVGQVLGRLKLERFARYNPEALKPSGFAEPGALLRVSITQRDYAQLAPLRLELGPQAALVALDPRTRNILALVGSYEGRRGDLNRAVVAQRQPASTFKPIGFAFAVDRAGYAPGSTLQLVRSRNTGPFGHPRNFRSLRSGLAASNNEMALSLFASLGLVEVVQYAHELGVHSELAALPSLALGAFEVNLLELTNTYATFASGGIYQEPRLITHVRATSGELKAAPAPESKRVMSEQAAYLITSMLRSVVERGTGRGALKLGRPLAGKTGTNDDATDAWFIGFSPELVAGVWVGFDDGTPMGRFESGSHTALPLWTDFMRAAHKQSPATDFVRPTGITDVEIDPVTGLLPYLGQEETVVEEFITGAEPLERAPAYSPLPPLEPVPGVDAEMAKEALGVEAEATLNAVEN